MKIAIVGAEGSGKTELAQKLKEELDERNSSCKNCSTDIVDDYVAGIGRETDLAVGGAATYIGNLYILLGRFQKERMAVQNGATNLITCGTLVETSIYATMEAVAGQTEPHWVRITNFMNLLGSFFQDTFDYDHVFVLTLDEPDENTHSGQLDKNLFMAINSFSIPYTPLNGTLEEKIKTAFEKIDEEDDEAFHPADLLKAPTTD